MSDHPKVALTIIDGERQWDEESGFRATHKVVPLDALVIERDDNGDWPEWATATVWARVRQFEGWSRPVGISEANDRLAGMALLDALEAAQKEGKP